jgi:hypothetical protein
MSALRISRGGLAVASALLLSAPAGAQVAAPGLPEDPRSPRFAEVERGLFAGFETGVLWLFDTPTADPAKYPFAGAGGGSAFGGLVGAHLGYDLADRLAASLFVLGGNAQASSSYGAFGLMVTGLDLRFSLLSARARNGVPSLHLYVHGRGGYVVTRPTGLLGTTDLLVAGGPGIEYFTRLRHFSVGLAADAIWLTQAGVAGVAVVPSVRYTF